jgi:CrcB protein
MAHESTTPDRRPVPNPPAGTPTHDASTHPPHDASTHPPHHSTHQPQHHSPRALALVAAGGLLGAAVREAVAQVDPTRAGTFPATTLTINLTGAFALGLLLEALARAGDDHGWRRQARLLAGTGFLGAYTTYSTLAVEADLLVRGGHTPTAALYALASALAGPVAAAAGIAAGAAGHRVATTLPIDPDLDDPDPDHRLDHDPDANDPHNANDPRHPDPRPHHP